MSSASSMIHAIQYDYYGKRIITCSSDGKAKIWCRNPDSFEVSKSPNESIQRLLLSSTEHPIPTSTTSSSSSNSPSTPTIPISSSTKPDWICQATIIPNLGTLWQSTWAHPEYGQIIALCGEHTIVTLWEEQETVDHQGNIISKWNKRAELGDARNSVYDIKFAPRHSGLRLATASGDGYVRIYEVTDIMNLTHWPLIDELYDDSNQNNQTNNNDNNKDEGINIPSNQNGSSSYRTNSKAITCLAWCTSQFDTSMLVVGNNYGKLRIWGYSSNVRKWVPMLDLIGNTQNISSNRILDVAWAPNIGRSYHYISASTVNGYVYLWKIIPDNSTDNNDWNRLGIVNYKENTTNTSTKSSDSEDKNTYFSSWKTSFYNSLPYFQQQQQLSSSIIGNTKQNNHQYVHRFPYSTANAMLTEIFSSVSLMHNTIDSSPTKGRGGGGGIWRTEWNISGTVLVTVEDNGIIVFRRQQFPNGIWQIIGMINEQGEELLYTSTNQPEGQFISSSSSQTLKNTTPNTKGKFTGIDNYYNYNSTVSTPVLNSASQAYLSSSTTGTISLSSTTSARVIPSSYIQYYTSPTVTNNYTGSSSLPQQQRTPPKTNLGVGIGTTLPITSPILLPASAYPSK